MLPHGGSQDGREEPQIHCAPGGTCRVTGHFGSVLLRFRLAAGYTQEDLADRCGLSARTISDLERGQVGRPRPTTVRLLADALDLSGTPRARFLEAARGRPSPEVDPAGIPHVTTDVARPRPAQLPADIPDFTGRSSAMARIRELLSAPADGEAVPVLVLSGPGGIGKSTLAVHACHELRHHFGDGQLYADLRGVGIDTASVTDVMRRFLRDLGGVRVPDTGDETTTLYRSVLAGRRVLILLDGARDVGQVHDLVPGSASCAVVITSRTHLPELAGAWNVDLDVLDPAESRTMFLKCLGDRQVSAESAAIAEVVRSCAGLPLAIRIAGARLMTRPGWSVATLAGRLAQSHSILDELKAGNLAVRAAFQLSYEQLTADGTHASSFRLLSLWPGRDITLDAAAALLGRPVAAVENDLEALVDARLLEAPVTGRYRMHELLHAFAMECAAREESPSDRHAAIDRIASWYLHAAVNADRLIAPHSTQAPG